MTIMSSHGTPGPLTMPCLMMMWFDAFDGQSRYVTTQSKRKRKIQTPVCGVSISANPSVPRSEAPAQYVCLSSTWRYRLDGVVMNMEFPSIGSLLRNLNWPSSVEFHLDSRIQPKGGHDGLVGVASDDTDGLGGAIADRARSSGNVGRTDVLSSNFKGVEADFESVAPFTS